MLGVARHLHAPSERGAADGEISHAFLEVLEDLVATRIRLDEARVGFDVGDEAVDVLRELEEVALLLVLRQRAAGDGGFVVVFLGFGLGDEGLLADVVPAGVGAEVDVARGLHLGDDGLDGIFVALLAGADEVVVAGVDFNEVVAELGHHLVGQFAGLDAELLGFGDHLLAVLIGAGEEERLPAGEAVEAGDGIGADGRVGVPEVRLARGVVDGRGDVEGALGHAGVG